MKKILFLLLLAVAGYGQTSTGQEQEFDYGIKNNSTQTITTPTYLTTTGTDGTQGKIPSAYIEKTADKISTITGYSETSYPNEKAAHDALDLKLNISDLPTNLTLYPTNVASDVGGYVKMVTDIHDVDYNTVAVDVSTPTITGTAQLVSQRISAPGVLIGQPGVFNITTFGNIKRLSGTGTANFYFEVYHRDLAGTETLICTSSVSDVVSLSTYSEFTASGIWDDGDFIATDRIVIKSYANRIAGGTDPVYQFQFGGSQPVRTLLPVPFSVVDAGYEMKTNKSDSYTASSSTTYASTKALVDGITNLESFSISKKTRTDINYVFEGDSRTATGAIPDYPAKLATLSNFAGTGTFYNVATGGEYIADIVSQYATQVYPKRPNGTTITEAYLFVLIGINDLSLANPDFASLANTVKSYCATAKADGFKVVLFTTFYRQGFTRTQELARQKYNDLLRGGYADYTMLIDLDNVFPPTQSSIFYLDSVHLISEGNDLIASYVNDKFPLGNTGNTLSNRNTMQDVFTPYTKFQINGDAEISSLAFSSPNLIYADTAGKLLVEHPFNVIGDTYIKNQNVSPQPTSSFNISGTGIIGNDLKIGSSFTGLNWPLEIHSTYNLSGWNSAFLSQNHTVDATYGGILLGHRENIGVIGEYSTRSIGIVPDGGNLLVGTTTNNGVDKLQVNGNISASPATLSTQVVIKSQLDSKADLASPTLTGTPTAPTATVGTNTPQIATMAALYNAMPYKKYIAMLTQTSTSAPTAKVLENTLGGTVVWTYSSTGVYVGTLTGAFTADKSPVILTSNNSGVTLTGGASGSTNFVGIETKVNGTLTDGSMTDSFIEIRVYP